MPLALRVLLVALSALLFASSARAQGRRGLDLAWMAPPGCPEQPEVLAEIERLLGGDRAITEAAPLRALGVIELGASGYRLELRFPSASSPDVVRTIESDRCDELDEAAAVVLALSLDPENPRLAAVSLPPSTTSAGAGAPSPAGTPAAPPAPPAPVPAAPAAAAAPAPPPTLEPSRSSDTAAAAPLEPVRFAPPSAGARFALEVGTLPSVALGGSLDVRVPLRPIVGVVTLSAFAPQEHSVNGAGGTFFLGALALGPCLRVVFERAALSPCALLEAAFIAANGDGVDQPEQPFTWFPRLGLGAELDYAFSSRVAAVFAVTGLLTPARPRFVVQNELELFRPEPFGARFSAGLEISF
jgi:hypothetical protein